MNSSGVEFQRITMIQVRVFIRHQRLENSLFTMQNSPTNIEELMTILYADVEPF